MSETVTSRVLLVRVRNVRVVPNFGRPDSSGTRPARLSRLSSVLRFYVLCFETSPGNTTVEHSYTPKILALWFEPHTMANSTHRLAYECRDSTSLASRITHRKELMNFVLSPYILLLVRRSLSAACIFVWLLLHYAYSKDTCYLVKLPRDPLLAVITSQRLCKKYVKR